jgi:glycosyltransferase involved in cell wall biosynthesis
MHKVRERRLDILAYAVSHHSFEQAAHLSAHFPGYRLATFSYLDPKWVTWVSSWSTGWARKLAKRSHPKLSSDFVLDHPSEQVRQLCCRLLGQPFSYFRAHDRMATRLTRKLAPPKNLICVDTGAEQLFQAWSQGTKRILDLTIGLPQTRSRIYDRARQAPGMDKVEFHYPGEWELDRYAAEIELADSILCPSEFVRDSCLEEGVSAEKCQVIPYGFDTELFSPDPAWNVSEGAWRCVFVGTFCYRKGSHILISILPELRRRFPGLELHIFGQVLDPPPEDIPGMVFHGHVPQAILARELRKMHLMIFPTYFEGSAYAVYQALASGVPVLTTRNCGSVVDDSCGRVLDFPNTDAFAEKVAEALENPERLYQWHENAPRHASRYSWDVYGQRIVKYMRKELETQK